MLKRRSSLDLQLRVLAVFSMMVLLSYKGGGDGDGHKILSVSRVVVSEDLKTEELEALRNRDHKRFGYSEKVVFGKGSPEYSLLGTFRDPFIGGLYYTTIQLGSPPRKFHVQIDTGSNDFWVNCKPCPTCPSKSKLGFRPNLYRPELSSTHSELPCSDPTCGSLMGACTSEIDGVDICSFSDLYTDGRGAFGYYLTDVLHFDLYMPNDSAARNSSSLIVFGCSIFHVGGLTQENQAIDGILGLGYLYPSVVGQLARERVTPSEIFSHCLGSDGNGSLIIGEFHHRDLKIVYTPLMPAARHYNLDLRSMTVGGKVLPIDPIVFNTTRRRGTFVDTGTSLSYLVADAYDAFIHAINSEIGTYAAPVVYNGTICYKMSSSKMDRFPSVGFNFAANATMVLKPKDYILRSRPLIDGVPSLCIGFLKNQIHNVTVLGDLVLQDKIIVYDVSNQQLGWSEYYNCSLSVLDRSSSHVGHLHHYLSIGAYVLFMMII